MSDSGEADTGSSSERRGKVKRVIDEYGLDGMGERLARRWRGDDGPRHSLRELADEFNREVLAAAMEKAELRPLDGEVQNLYRLLTDDEVSGGQRAQAEVKLERNEIDPDDLTRDFVSHQAIHTYLTKHRGVELPEDDGEDRSRRKAETIQRTRGRLQSVTESALEALLTDEELVLGDFDVLVPVQVYCEDCDRQFDVADLLERGGCDCESTP